eukprot:366028-Chlamydomonas_euryale.AAC.11
MMHSVVWHVRALPGFLTQEPSVAHRGDYMQIIYAACTALSRGSCSASEKVGFWRRPAPLARSGDPRLTATYGPFQTDRGIAAAAKGRLHARYVRLQPGHSPSRVRGSACPHHVRMSVAQDGSLQCRATPALVGADRCSSRLRSFTARRHFRSILFQVTHFLRWTQLPHGRGPSPSASCPALLAGTRDRGHDAPGRLWTCCSGAS